MSLDIVKFLLGLDVVGGSGGGSAPSTNFIAVYNSGISPASPVTVHTAAPIGAAAVDRVVVVAVYVSGAASTITGVSVGATNLVSWGAGVTSLNLINFASLEFWLAVVPAGTTGDVVVTYTGSTPLTITTGVWTAYAVSVTPYSTVTSPTANSTTAVLSALARKTNGAVFSIAICQNPTTMTESWTGAETVTEDFDQASLDGNSEFVGCHFLATANASDSLTFTMGTAKQHVAAALSLQPA